MRVGFYHAGASEIHERMAARLIVSCRIVMPTVEIVQFTDDRTVAVAGVDAVLRGPNGPIALRCLEAYESAGAGEWLFVDTDTEIRADVRNVFDLDFDIAVADREGTLLPKEVGTKFMATHRFNKGAVFSRSSDFWRAAAALLYARPIHKQEWMGDQFAMNQAIETGKFRVKVLPSLYNYPPREKGESLADKAIVHWKGRRKAWALA